MSRTIKHSRTLSLMNNLGPTIKALRKLRGMTQAELARRSNLERTSITNIEAGKQTLTSTSITAIAAALGYEVHVSFRLPKR
ncbi:helix-turn-helix domain-containing protein [Ralstonia sp. Ralssp135]|uniref:helix-turn-helix domain-containing protein n=1 Tax=Ralstonia sp. Ralssp135 TaxID=3243016 RepID=UPI0039AF51D0